MSKNNRKGVYFLIGTAVGLITGIYHTALKEIIKGEISSKRPSDFNEKSKGKADKIK